MKEIYNCSLKIEDNLPLDLNGQRMPAASSIPRDILSEIFLYAMHRPFNDVDAYDPSVPTVAYLSGANPIKLGHVSSYWRSVALTTAKIWSTICIDHPVRSHINLFKLWLDRAGTHPLHITIKCSTDLPIQLSYFSAIYQLTLTKVKQWRFIDFEVPLEYISSLSRALKGQKKNMMQLQYAAISVQRSDQRSMKIRGHENESDILAIDSIWEAVHASPALRQVNWKNLYQGVKLPEHAPYRTLERLELDYSLEPIEIVQILKRSPAIKKFRACGLPASSTKSPTRIPYGLSDIIHGLKSLSVIVDGSTGLDYVLDSLTLLSLQILHITYRGKEDGDRARGTQTPDSDGLPFEQFLQRSACPLQDVWLKNVPYGDAKLCLLLSSPSFQTITRLRLTGTNTVTEKIIRLLTVQRQNGDILPNIKHLWLELEAGHIADGVLSTMVASRWTPQNYGDDRAITPTHQKLTEVHIKRDFHLAFGVVDITKLFSMAANGLRVSISPGTLHVIS